MIFRIIIWSLILGMLLRFVLRIVLPFFQIASMAQSRIRQMQQQMEDMHRQQSQPAAPQQHHAPKQVDGDYIDYEEVK